MVRELGVAGRALSVSHAFHSPLMAPAESAFRRVVESVELSANRVPLASTVTGGPARSCCR